MRHAILSDVHANLPALTAVLADARAHGAARIVCLGDLVGYHGFVHETLALLRDRDATCVAGNHDLMVVGRLPTASCGPLARRAVAWTRNGLTRDEVAFLDTLPLVRRLDGGTILVHSLPWSTEARMRIEADFAVAARQCRSLMPEVDACFTGHTHLAGAVRVRPDGSVARYAATRIPRRLGDGNFWFVNPGTVGHPRDARPSASYLLFDDDTRRVRFRRVRYDRQALRRRDTQCGLAAPAGAPPVATRAWRLVRSMAARGGAS